MKGEESEVKAATQKLAGDLGEQLGAKYTEILDSVLQKGVVPKESLGFTDEKMNDIYGQAYRLYNTGKFQEALQLFRVLIVLDSTESKYTLGFGACFHMLKEYENAIQAYTIASIIDAQDPVPLFHASDCYIQMNDPASAIVCLDMAMQRAGEKPDYKLLKERAALTIESLKKDLIKMANEKEE